MALTVGEGEQVRQVAHGGEGGVVVLGRHLQHLQPSASHTSLAFFSWAVWVARSA